MTRVYCAFAHADDDDADYHSFPSLLDAWEYIRENNIEEFLISHRADIAGIPETDYEHHPDYIVTDADKKVN